MNPSTMNDLALLSIGLGGGFLLAVIAGMIYVLHRAAYRMGQSVERMIALAHHSEGTIDKLRTEVTLALSRVDAERLYSSSLAIQRSAKLLGQQVDQFQKVVFAQPPQPAIDFTAGGLADEAEDDARMLADRNRWQAGGNLAGNPYQPTNQPPADPLAGLSEEDRRQRTLEYFERRRAAQAGFPYSPNPFNPPSTPPSAGSGLYASLIDEASQLPKPVSQPIDFSGLEDEEGVELSEKGELS